MSDGWISVESALPESQSLKDACNDYCFVWIEGYGAEQAMFINGEWYITYSSKIFRRVTHWMEIRTPEA